MAAKADDMRYMIVCGAMGMGKSYFIKSLCPASSGDEGSNASICTDSLSNEFVTAAPKEYKINGTLTAVDTVGTDQRKECVDITQYNDKNICVVLICGLRWKTLREKLAETLGIKEEDIICYSAYNIPKQPDKNYLKSITEFSIGVDVKTFHFRRQVLVLCFMLIPNFVKFNTTMCTTTYALSPFAFASLYLCCGPSFHPKHRRNNQDKGAVERQHQTMGPRACCIVRSIKPR